MKKFPGVHFKVLDGIIQVSYDTKRCTKCTLSDTFPDITFNDAGVCSYCTSEGTYLPQRKEDILQKVENILSQASDKRKYDCLVLYSGGKDSSYALYFLTGILRRI